MPFCGICGGDAGVETRRGWRTREGKTGKGVRCLFHAVQYHINMLHNPDSPASSPLLSIFRPLPLSRTPAEIHSQLPSKPEAERVAAAQRANEACATRCVLVRMRRRGSGPTTETSRLTEAREDSRAASRVGASRSCPYPGWSAASKNACAFRALRASSPARQWPCAEGRYAPVGHPDVRERVPAHARVLCGYAGEEDALAGPGKESRDPPVKRAREPWVVLVVLGSREH
jgi:hypothetical protein